MDGDNRQPDSKRVKTEFCSDNSVSLPGILPGSSGPVGFEPGMFKNDDENSRHSRSKSKDKEKSSDGTSKVHKILFKSQFKFKSIDFRNYLFIEFLGFFFQKKKKKEKKKHKHKHKHKHKTDSKDKDKKDKEKKDPNISRLLVKEETPETLSSAETSSNSNQTFQDLTSTM